MTRRHGRRQRVRRALLIVSLLLFPVIMYYLSPYVIIFGASQGIVNGSLLCSASCSCPRFSWAVCGAVGCALAAPWARSPWLLTTVLSTAGAWTGSSG